AVFAFIPALLTAQWHGPDIPDSLSFQGFLTDTLGTTVPDGSYNLLFKMYKGSTKVWEQNQLNVSVKSGGFDVILGSPTSPLDTVAFSEPIDLGITVNGGTELTPRTPLTSAAYALGMRGMYAIAAEDGFNKSPNLIGGASNNFVADGVVGATIGGGGGWAFSSAFPDSVLGDWGTVGGGRANTAGGSVATVGGGESNTAGGSVATVGGGRLNTAGGFISTVGGGEFNTASGVYASVGGGQSNTAGGSYATIGGGWLNKATNIYATVGGGQLNTAGGSNATVGGGRSNTADGSDATVGGGQSNMATNIYATVPGGQENSARGSYSFASGFNAKAIHDGSFVWSDRSGIFTSDSMFTTGSNQFLIRAVGGVGIGTSSPMSELHVSSKDLSLTSSPIFGEELVVEAEDAVLGLYSENTGNWGSALVLAHMTAGTLDSKWALIREAGVNTDLRLTYGTSDNYALNTTVVEFKSSGDVNISGNISKAGGSFKIDHPLDPENKYLYHSFVESPDMMNVYNGNVVLEENGEAIVELPSYFEALNREYRYLLTAIGKPGPNLYIASKISGNQFSIAGGTAGMEVSWQVTGIRKDPYAEQNPIKVEVDKPAEERGTYLHPEAYKGTH
ncbi:MAG: hypothetical protein ACC655_06200, partial [Rhodothermia bacterium]